ncbi:MAG: hypothetical protein E2O86_03235 [Bacteroidetes bacterium]|nr:MAG: hypothetical protein E2O86_03235 [Bacteroidota bacterium]
MNLQRIALKYLKDYRSFSIGLFAIVLSLPSSQAQTTDFELEIKQLTFGEKHHFFGYIGQCRTIPWNESGQYILGMEIDRIDRMPKPEEAAKIFIIDTKNDNKIIYLDKTNAWNPQQGTMFYWNPNAAETQFFFNDRDVESGEVFTVLYDIKKKKRIKEYRFDNTHIGNGGVAWNGSFFMGLNYGRLARLRLVTGYPESLDWSKDELAPENDGIFKVDIETGEKELLVSYRQLENMIKKHNQDFTNTGLFINHTLLNRDATRLYFFAREGWFKGGNKTNVAFSVHLDGSNLKIHKQHIGGHPEWAEGSIMIGREGKKQILYDVDQSKVVGQLGTPELFPDPEGDISLSPDANWFVNGYKVQNEEKGNKNYFAVYRLNDSTFARSEGIDKGTYLGNIRIDPAPRWNRTNDAILVPGISKNKTRQMFVIRVIVGDKTSSVKTK